MQCRGHGNIVALSDKGLMVNFFSGDQEQSSCQGRFNSAGQGLS